MKLNDKITLSVAEAVKQVVEDSKDFKPHTMYDPKTGKAYEAKSLEDHLKMKDMGYTHEKPSEKNETEVQDSDKDFVDLHSVDKKKNPEKERQVEETEVEDEDEVEEGNAFGQAVTDAKKAGKKKFKFQGKEYKVESVELEKANVLSSDEYDEVSNFKNFNKKDWKWNAIQKKFVRLKKVKESVDLEEDADLEEATMSQGVKTAATQIYSLEKSLKAGSNLNKGVNKSLEGKYDADFKKMQKAIGDIVSVWEEIERDFSDMNESTDLEEAVTPADFVKGGDTKVTKREVDGMLSKLFIDTKLAKAVEANSAFKAGEKSNGKKNPYKKDSADFHLFILGQQSADADS